MFNGKNDKSNYLSNEYNLYNLFYFCQITDQSAQQLRALVRFRVQSQNSNNEPWNRWAMQLPILFRVRIVRLIRLCQLGYAIVLDQLGKASQIRLGQVSKVSQVRLIRLVKLVRLVRLFRLVMLFMLVMLVRLVPLIWQVQ